jgi:hypothetical protein
MSFSPCKYIVFTARPAQVAEGAKRKSLLATSSKKVATCGDPRPCGEKSHTTQSVGEWIEADLYAPIHRSTAFRKRSLGALRASNDPVEKQGSGR